MDATRRMKRDAKIIRMYEDGVGCPRIAEVVRVKPPRVRSILKAKGYDLGGWSLKSTKTPIVERFWDLSPDEQRRRIAERERAGAREALQAFGGAQ